MVLYTFQDITPRHFESTAMSAPSQRVAAWSLPRVYALQAAQHYRKAAQMNPSNAEVAAKVKSLDRQLGLAPIRVSTDGRVVLRDTAISLPDVHLCNQACFIPSASPSCRREHASLPPALHEALCCYALQQSPTAAAEDPLQQFTQRIIGMTRAAVAKDGLASLRNSVSFWPREILYGCSR
jgi:hypothetical protein